MVYKKEMSGKILKSYQIKDFLKLEEGRNTANFKRFKTKNEERQNQSFSIILENRTIDLESVDGQKQRIVKAVNALMKLKSRYQIEN